MPTPRFLEAFRRLLSRWSRYQDAPRDPERVTELAEARVELDEARHEVADARDEIIEPELVPPAAPKQTSVSDEDLARLRVEQLGNTPDGG